MNSFWSLFNWFLPAIRLPDDLRLDDPESLAGRTYALHHQASRTLSTSTRHTQPPAGQPPRLQTSESDWQRQERRKEAERTRDAERAAARERERDRDRDRHELGRLRDENKELKRRVQDLERTLELSQRSVLFLTKVPPAAPAGADLPRLPDSHVKRLQIDYAALQSSHLVLQQALRDRNDEVSSLQMFLSKTDVKSGAEIIQSVELLNAEIGQLAARMTDGVAGELKRQRTKIYPADFELLYPALGVPLADMLYQQDFQPNGGLEADTMLLQIAIQAWEVACVGKILRSFCCGASRDVEQTLSAIFQRMRMHESQATAARWRALTHIHLRAIIPPPASASGSVPPTPVTPSSSGPVPSNPVSMVTTTSADENLSGIISILALSGYHKLSRTHLKANHGTDISVITKKAFELATVIREGIMSATFEPVVVAPSLRKSGFNQTSERQGRLRVDTDDGEVFDDASMKDGFAAAGITSENKRVLCTVELGLAYVKRKDDPMDGTDGGDPQGAGGRHVPNGHEAARLNGTVKTNGAAHDLPDVLDRTLLLKPKVILEVALKSLAAAPPDAPPESPVDSSPDSPI